MSKSRRKRIAAVNEIARETRTPEEQVKILDSLFGEGVGAKKERERLQKTIDKEGE
jgi:hypothetical protein